MSDILLELFREEAATNLNVLANGLIEGEHGGLAPKDIEPLMRAAHSLKGAARVIGLTPFVDVAHLAEDILVAAQNGATQLVNADFDLLLSTVELLREMVESSGPGFQNWYSNESQKVDQHLDQLSRRAAGEAIVQPKPAKPTSTETKAPEKAVEMEIPAEAAPSVDASAETPQFWTSLTDQEPGPMLDLMKSELAKSMTDFQAVVETANGDPKKIANLVDNIRECRGCALLVEATQVVELTNAIEKVLQGLVENPGNWQTVQPWLRDASKLLDETGKACGEGFAKWTESQASRAAAIFHVGSVGSQTPKVEKESVKAPAPVAVVEPVVAAPKAPVSNEVPKKEAPPPPPKPQVPAPAPASRRESKETVSEGAQAERIVRINAQALEKLMGLAGESLLEARWLQAFAQSLQRLRRQQSILQDEMDEILGALGKERVDLDRLRETLQGYRQKFVGQGELLVERVTSFEEHARQSDDLNSRLYREVILSRMTPFRNGVQGFPKMVRDICKQLGKQAKLEIRGMDTEVDRDILDKLDAPLTHMIRNSLDHGLELPEDREAAGKNPSGNLVLEARHAAGMLVITLSDDGRGVNLDRIRSKIIERRLASADMVGRMSETELLEFLFLPGFSTAGAVTELSGRGVGLDVVHSTITSVGGSVRLTSTVGKGTTFHMQLPLTLSVIRAVLARISGDPYAFPHHRIDGLMRVPASELRSLQDRQFFVVDGRNVGLVLARQILQVDGEAESQAELPVILFSSHGQSYALLVDEFVGEQDLAVRPIDPRLGKVPYVHASAILDDGSPVLILDVDDLRRGIDRLLDEGRLRRTDAAVGSAHRRRRKKVLITDDSITVREVQRQLLSGRGYEVQTAVDGVDGYNIAREESFDLIISDIDMPRMNGIEFVTKIRADGKLKDTPVVVVSYKDREEDRLRGLEAGANYYLTKSSFQDDTLLQVVHELIGEPNS
jgi:two-component system sensor histidine kinase and response regulator WspE